MSKTVLKKTIGGIVFNKDFESLLKKNRLFDIDNIMDIKGDEIIKNSVKERKTVSFTIDNNGIKQKIYLKKYSLSLLRRLFSKNAVDEFNALSAFHHENIPTLTPVCAGQKIFGLSGEKSFLITDSLNNVERLDRVLSENCLSKNRWFDITSKVARLIKKMHGCGFIHKDLYLCHILMDEKDNLFIVDLHRVKRFKKPPLRYIVKDFAALNYSADEINIKTSYKMRFLKEYFSITRLTPETKGFIKKVVQRTEKMKKHNRKR